jgi:hypothetical protein
MMFFFFWGDYKKWFTNGESGVAFGSFAWKRRGVDELDMLP